LQKLGNDKMFYKVFMLIAIPALIIGWIAYWLWQRKIEEEEKNKPKQESQRLTKTKSEVSDWAKKMAEFESPAEQARKRKLAQQKALEEKQRQQEQKNQQ
jgi:hypothetical protein